MEEHSFESLGVNENNGLAIAIQDKINLFANRHDSATRGLLEELNSYLSELNSTVSTKRSSEIDIRVTEIFKQLGNPE